MSSNVKYTILSQPYYHLQSAIHSYGIDHNTEKDLRSFYQNFSKYSYIDTGLLPVFGSGLLSLRGAGGHYQVAYQHAPNKYLINWGAYEGDPSTRSYLLAQPYRIVIIDIVDNSIYGARHFYSPYPINHLDAPLYHVNLPNLNCKGYTNGVGVGWICLYHNTSSSNIEDFSQLLRIGLERTSGVEPYNDRNMAETDGINFYRNYYDNSSDYSFLWRPQEWEAKTEQEGIAWTLDEDLWAPIKVSSMDDQASHYENGEQFTFRYAILGNYKAYYYDNNVPKLVNIIAREDLQLSSSTVYTLFTKAHNSTSLYDSTTEPAVAVQLNDFSLFPKNDTDQIQIDEDHFMCHLCDEIYEDSDRIETVDGFSVCSDCTSELHFVEHLGEYFLYTDDLIFDDNTSTYYSINHLQKNYHYYACEDCGDHYFDNSTISQSLSNILNTYVYPFPKDKETFSPANVYAAVSVSSSLPDYWQSEEDGEYYCGPCLESRDIDPGSCASCGCYIPKHSDFPEGFNPSIPQPSEKINAIMTNSFINIGYQNAHYPIQNAHYPMYNEPYMKEIWFEYCPQCRVKYFNTIYQDNLYKYIKNNFVDNILDSFNNLLSFATELGKEQDSNYNDSLNILVGKLSKKISEDIL